MPMNVEPAALMGSCVTRRAFETPVVGKSERFNPRPPVRDVLDGKTWHKTYDIALSKKTPDPFPPNVKALTHHEHQYRLRVGHFRVVFDFDGVARIVSIEEVKKRDEHTY